MLQFRSVGLGWERGKVNSVIKMKIRYKKVPKFKFVWLISLGGFFLLYRYRYFQTFLLGPRGLIWEMISLKLAGKNKGCSLFSFLFAVGTPEG